MFKNLTGAEIEKRVADLQQERLRLLSDLKKMTQEITRIRSEIDNKSRVYFQYKNGYASLKRAPVVSMKTYGQVRDTINEIVDAIEPKEAEEEKAKNDATQLRKRIDDIDAVLAAAPQAISQACQVIYGHFGPGSKAP